MKHSTGAVMAPSIIRTVTPVLVGYLAAWLVTVGVGLDERALAGLEEALGALFAVVYYIVVRAIEQKWPRVGVLLGWAQTPDSYSAEVRPETVHAGPEH